MKFYANIFTLVYAAQNNVVVFIIFVYLFFLCFHPNLFGFDAEGLDGMFHVSIT